MEDDDSLWLREQIDDEEILSLFTANPDQLRSAVRHLIDRARDDAIMEARLIEALEIAVDQGCDDSQASTWIAIILGEARSRNSIGILVRCLGYEEDETLQDAAGVALLRIGTPAVVFVMDCVDEGHGHLFNRTAYDFLADTGVLEDEVLRKRVLDFLEERFPEERRIRRQESALEELVRASARLGHRELLKPIKRLLAREYSNVHPVLEDAILTLDENTDGVPFVPTIPPWDERYGWLFEDELDTARVERPEIAPGWGFDSPGGGDGHMPFIVPGADPSGENPGPGSGLD